MRFNQFFLVFLLSVLANSFLFSFDFLETKFQPLSSVSSSRIHSSPSEPTSIGFDFNIGGGFGFYQTPAVGTTLNNTFSITGWNSITINKFSHENYSWTGGGFVGLGISFGEELPMAIGFEYKGEYLSSQKSLVFDLTSDSEDSLVGKRIANLNGYKHSVDLYYKITFIESNFPIGLQLMSGLAMFNPISSSVYETQPYQSQITFDRVNYLVPTLGMGFHLGARVHFHMLYIGLDYNYLAYFSQAGKSMITNQTLDFARNSVNFSIGLVLNNSVLSSLLGM